VRVDNESTNCVTGTDGPCFFKRAYKNSVQDSTACDIVSMLQPRPTRYQQVELIWADITRYGVDYQSVSDDFECMKKI
jgi:hypothetical protein